MKDLGITKGEWESIFRNNHAGGVKSDKGFICFMTMPLHYSNQNARYDEELEECRHDAELIADAGNTAQKCGLLPSELLKQKDELLEALKVAHQHYMIHGGSRPDPLSHVAHDMNKIIVTAITKAKEG